MGGLVSKDRSRGEFEKLRGLSAKDKLWYIWNYYNYFIIGGIIAVILIVSLVRTCYFTPGIGLFIAWESPFVEDAQMQDFEDSLSFLIFEQENIGNTVVSVSRFTPLSDDIAAQAAAYDRLVAMLSANAIDLFVLNEVSMRNYARSGYLLPLEEALEQVRLRYPQVYEDLNSRIVTALTTTDGDVFQQLPVGINIKDSPLLAQSGIAPNNDTFLCVAISSRQLYNAVSAMIELYK